MPAATDAAKRSTIETLVAASENRVQGFYGTLESKPKIFVCPDEACYQRVGGGRSHGMALIDWAFFVSPRGLDPVIVSHELSHIELHHRTGAVATFRRDIPQWFDEGLAVTISDDPRYLKPAGEADRCLIRSDEPLPTTRGAWVENASSHDLYAKAACRVSTWLAAHGGAKGVIDMVDHLNAGETFDAIYHRPSA